jgi:hypothetical protein
MLPTVNPRIPDDPRKRPPTESGERLACVARFDGEDELRVAPDERDHHLFVSVRVWTKDKVGQWRPNPKGVTIRLSKARARPSP